MALSTSAMTAVDGLTTLPSAFDARETMDRLEAELRSRGVSIFDRIDHAAGAAQAGLALRPTELLIFGSPKAGTPLMQANQSVGIDLPLKALVWKDASGKVWLSYNDPSWVARRHGLDAASTPTTQAMSASLSAAARNATQA
jgi:uncharacterized protein (DUF302 family)